MKKLKKILLSIKLKTFCKIKNFNVYAYYTHKTYMPAKVRVFLDFLVEELAARVSDHNGDTDQTDDTGTGSGDGKTLSNLVLSVLLPRAIFSQLGGILADKYDKRQLMISLDVLSGIVVLGYLLAIRYNSLPLIYAVTTIRSALGALYYPITTGIMPQLVPNSVVDLQLAVTINSWAWSCTSIVGGLLAGTITASIGLSSCYIIDCVTFFISAMVMFKGVHGNFKVGYNNNNPSDSHHHQVEHNGSDEIVLTVPSPISKPIYLLRYTYTVFQQLGTYLWTCGFGLLVFQKSAASFVWGIEDIVGAEFSTVFDQETGEEDEEQSSWNMGLLFSSIGLGCMVGPAIVNIITSADKPYSLQRACVIGLCFLTVGWFSIGTFAIDTRQNQYYVFLFYTFIRTMGSGVVWVNATLILQTLSDRQILGRVLAAEYTLATLSEALSSTISGTILADKYGYNKNQLALFGSMLGVCVVLFWGTYYALGRGAASSRFNRSKIASLSSTTTSTRKNGSITINPVV